MHPCQTCGACCAFYRVAFHWLETQPSSFGVPEALTETLDSHRLVMRGTRAGAIRCTALDAEIGRTARCTIYPQRPSVCRDVAASWEFGQASAQCDKARLAHGLPVLTPADWPVPVEPAANDNPPPTPYSPDIAV